MASRLTRNGGVALITGAAGAIGGACAESFAEAGAHLALVDVERQRATMEERLEALRERHPGLEGSVHGCDVADAVQVGELARAIDVRWGRLDWLALVAGILHDAHPVDELAVEDWDRVLGVNLSGPFLVSRALVPLMKRGEPGAIVTIGSWYGRLGHAFFAAYCASKAGVIVLTQVLAAELAPHGIRANSVSPGNVDTPMHHKALVDAAAERGIGYEEMRDAEWAKIPLGRPSPPRDIAEAVVFLCSEDAASITGASLDVNGGVLLR